MTIFEKPLTFEDFKSVNDHTHIEVDVLIKALNIHIKRGELKIPHWAAYPTDVKILSAVSKIFRQVGWAGIEQSRNKINKNSYSIKLIPPQCMCNKEDSEDTCEICKGD